MPLDNVSNKYRQQSFYVLQYFTAYVNNSLRNEINPKETNMKYRIRYAILDTIGLLAIGIICFGIPTLFFVAIQ